MYYRDHGPRHFHASYGEHEATIVIGDLEVVTGFLPTLALRLVISGPRCTATSLRPDGRW